MDQIEEEVLKENKIEICKDLIAIYVLDHLVNNDILSEQDKSEILMSGHSVDDIRDLHRREFVFYFQNERLFDKLINQIRLKNGKSICKTFIDAMYNEDCYPWLGKKLKQSLDEKLAKKLAIKLAIKCKFQFCKIQ